MNTLDEKKEIAETFVGICLKRLVELGHVERATVEGAWRIEFDATRLQDRALGAGATLDANNQPVLYLRPDLNVESLLNVIAHESVHMMQLCNGDLVPYKGYSLWKGALCPNLPPDHEEYLQAQPWEQEAEELRPAMLETLKATMGKYRAT